MSIKSVEIGKTNLKIADGNYSAKYPRSDEFVTNGIPFIRANNFFNKSIKDEDMYYISKIKHAELKKGHIKPRDVLITTRGNIGKVAIVPERHDDSNINAQIVLLRCNEGWHPEYLLYALASDFVTRQFPSLTTGTALKQLPVKNLKKLKIPLPPLPEQQKIAAILDAADQLRQKDQQLIEKYTALSQSLFLDMFGDPVINSMGWNKLRLMEIAEKITDGTHKTPKYVEKGTLFLSAKNIKNNQLALENVKYITLAEHDLLSNRCNVEKGDILITKSGSIGMAGMVDIDVNFSIFESLALIKYTREKINGKFLLYFMNTSSTQHQYSRHTKGVGVKHLHLVDLRSIKTILPPIILQNQFADRIQAIESQKKQAQTSLKKSEDLFNSLLQCAFKAELTGH